MVTIHVNTQKLRDRDPEPITIVTSDKKIMCSEVFIKGISGVGIRCNHEAPPEKAGKAWVETDDAVWYKKDGSNEWKVINQ